MRHLTGKKRLWLVPLFIIGIAALVFVTMFLWNALMPQIFNLPHISYWQAAGMLILSRLLFGFGGHGRHGHWHHRNNLREKWEKMSPEEREKFKEHLHAHPRFWDHCHEVKNDSESK